MRRDHTGAGSLGFCATITGRVGCACFAGVATHAAACARPHRRGDEVVRPPESWATWILEGTAGVDQGLGCRTAVGDIDGKGRTDLVVGSGDIGWGGWAGAVYVAPR